jgi:hypothetical protein
MTNWLKVLCAIVAVAAILSPCAVLAENATPEEQATPPEAATPSPDAESVKKSKAKPRVKPERPRRAEVPKKTAPPSAVAPKPAPAPVAAPIVLPNPPLPVVQARQLGLAGCAPMLDSMARESLTTTYDVQSGWSPDAPANHVFQSVAVLNRPGNVPPDGLAALIAAPLAAGACDGVIVQVFPLAGDCAGAQKVLLAGGGKTLGPLLNARIMLDAAQRRLFLLPGYANTCIAVAVDSRFAPH